MNISAQKAIVEECQNLLVNLNIKSQKEKAHQIIRSITKTIISSQSIYQITIKIEHQSLSMNRDLIFHSSYSETFEHIVNTNITFVHVQNDEFINMIILQHTCLDNITEYEKEDCYVKNTENVEFVIFHLSKIISMSETHLDNEIIIYSELNSVTILVIVAKTYSDL